MKTTSSFAGRYFFVNGRFGSLAIRRIFRKQALDRLPANGRPQQAVVGQYRLLASLLYTSHSIMKLRMEVIKLGRIAPRQQLPAFAGFRTSEYPVVLPVVVFDRVLPYIAHRGFVVVVGRGRALEGQTGNSERPGHPTVQPSRYFLPSWPRKRPSG